MTTIKFLNGLITLASFCLIGLTALVCYWLFFPYEVVRYNLDPIPVLQTLPEDINRIPDNRSLAEYKPGDRIILLHDYCRLLEAKVEATVEMIDGVKFDLPYVASQSKPGCQRRTSEVIRLPSFFYSDEPVKLHFTLRYQVNPIRTITYHIETEYFLVKNGEQNGY